ncbi:PHA/PHB synthase family protein [Spirillospora sp. NPDC048911]|uniref:PHA/PHB synthase family protein n=1 Tax=Spirillospora sp. NPDC048911 TaxID=3364527 RepID=UPI003713D854
MHTPPSERSASESPPQSTVHSLVRAERRFVADLLRTTAATLWSGPVHPAATAVPASGDARFADPAWRDERCRHLLQQLYLLGSRLALETVEGLPVDRNDARFLRRLAQLAIDVGAPTNTLLGNPAALRLAWRTRGHSAFRGALNLLGDVTTGRRLPAMVDPTAFQLGKDLAATPGRVVLRNRIIELIQYEARTPTVHTVPMLLSPPWVNKFYVADLAPGRSVVQWLIEHGHTVFSLSYRNPDRAMRDVGIEDYLRALLEALKAIEHITGADRVNITGACLGGLLVFMAAAWLPAGQLPGIGSISAFNTRVDFTDVADGVASGVAGRLLRGAGLDLFDGVTAFRGTVPGRELDLFFRLLRFNDLVGRYVITNWLMGEQPGGFDVLAWNADHMDVPHRAQLYLLRELSLRNSFAQGRAELAGRRLRLDRITQDVFIVAARGDHIIPWQASYRTIGLLPGDVRFHLASGGHIAGIVAPPHPKARYWTGGQRPPPDPDAWLAEATERHGTWWSPWTQWLAARSGPQRDPPSTGSDRFPALEPAPGTYVYG